MMRRLGDAQLGVMTFCTASHPNDGCGVNGLPLTPNSIKVLGRFQTLKKVNHPRLCRYVDLIRGNHERVLVVAEHHKASLVTDLGTEKYNSDACLRQLAHEVLDGLSHLNSQSLVHRNLSPQNILFDTQGHVKLAKYGLYHMTDSGATVPFPIGLPKYMAPEVVAEGHVKVVNLTTGMKEFIPSGPKVDIWSLGLILIEAFTGRLLWEDRSLSQIFKQTVTFAMTPDENPLDVIVKQHNLESAIKEMSSEMEALIRGCLQVIPSKRPTAASLLKSAMFAEFTAQPGDVYEEMSVFSTTIRSAKLELHNGENNDVDCSEELNERSLTDVYYLWGLAGGDLYAALGGKGLLPTHPPILSLHNFVTKDGDVFGEKRDQSEMFDDTVVLLSLDELRQRLQNIDQKAYHILLEDESCSAGDLPTSPSSGDLSESSRLPLVIREKDVEYQFHRLMLYSRLLEAYPYKRAHIWKEARVDVPPPVRAHVWAALLQVEGDVYGRYTAIDKESPISPDRQIEVDVPRCHQYCDLLSSSEGHAKLRRLLKAWVASHPEYVYWQGLDSLAAPFILLNFNDEALAFACLSAFIPKYLHQFFLKDNSHVIQEYLAVFSHLVAFHEPELSTHMDAIGFIPDLYAIPWFLTMFAHVLPLSRLLHLWDTLLLGTSSFPLFIGVAVLRQLRDQLLSFGFNDCILLFSDMPEIAIDRCVRDSIHIFCSTPKSATYRQHARPAQTRATWPARPNVSYYSRDLVDDPTTQLSIETISLADLKAEKCPRVSAADLLELAELSGAVNTRSPTKRSRNAKPTIIVIDVRSTDEYQRGMIPGSLSIPFSSAFSADGSLLPCAAVTTLRAARSQVKVIVGGSRGKQAVNFAGALVVAGYPRVCVLHRGIESVRSVGILTVPTADI